MSSGKIERRLKMSGSKTFQIAPAIQKCALALFMLIAFRFLGHAQTSTVEVDRFDPAGTGGKGYSSGQITNVWGNWFGDAFQSLAWDSTSDASNNPASGSMEVSANFNGQGSIPNQFAVFNGFNGIVPPLNGLHYTNFQCDVRFAKGSATINNTFGHLEFGIAVGFNQDYFASVDVPSSNTNWVHVSVNLNATTDANLQNINDLLIHIYGPSMSGTATFWVDNLQFTGPALATNGQCTVDWRDVHQRIDGFGASSAWMSGSLSTADADLLFSTNTGAGLSLLRTRIAPDGTSWETSIAQQAQARGARIWSTPWSPPAIYKDTNSVNGGNLAGNTANYQGYAAQLANYVAAMKNTYGISLYGVSVQNEPDVNQTYESCVWTARQIHDFVPYLSIALSNHNVASTKIMLPEDEFWQTNLFLTAMNDPTVAAMVGIIANHNYDGSPNPGVFTNYGKALWETEVSTFGDYDGSMADAIYWAGRIHLFMTVAQANAFHYWWLFPSGSDNEGLTDQSHNPAKRLFVLGNFSRFVRPNFYRIGVMTNTAATTISAYKDSSSPNFAIVAINPNPVAINQEFQVINGFAIGPVTPWITSGSLSLSNQPAISVTNSVFTYALPPMSVVTFVGQNLSVPANIAISGATFQNNSFVLAWNATPGAFYRVLKTNVPGGPTPNWPAIITGYPFGGATGGSVSYTDATATASESFYRVASP